MISPSDSDIDDTNSTDELSAHYYLGNFVELIDTVEAQYGDLLLSPEKELIAGFRALNHAAQCLYVRLISRQGPLFRLEKLVYDEIGPLDEPLRELFVSGLASDAQRSTIAELGKVFTRAELGKTFGDTVDCPKSVRKAQLLEALEQLDLSPTQLCHAISDGADARLLRICGSDSVVVLQLLFFGNTRQSLTDFVLSDLGVVNYFPYRLDREGRLFESRAALDEYIVCGLFSERFYALVDTGDREGISALALEMLGVDISFVTSRRRWAKICNRVARELERSLEFTAALALYQRSETHPARERTARILESKKEWPKVTALCEEIQSAPWCEAEYEAASRIHARAARIVCKDSVPRSKDCFDEFGLLLPLTDLSVEQSVADALRNQWASVHFLENKLMNTLFGLAFWEQIFMSVPGVFHNPYQSVPADMYDGHFRERRKSELEARMALLAEVDLREELNRARALYENYQCRWVDWHRVSAEIQDAALTVIPAEHLLAIWQRQLFDPRENRNGFPDLIAFGESPGDYRMIEVKAPGDRLQDNQKRWLRYFAQHNMPASVAWVDWCDD
ncbi:MAG: VRR-NUC domain-containing protein [Halioglobus sp.]